MGWLDVLVGALLAGFGVALVVVLIVDGGTLLEVSLVVLLIGGMTLNWMRSSYGWETLSEFWKRGSRQ